MAVYQPLVSTYARNIYLYGTRRFTTRDGVTGINAEYHEPVKQYAVNTFSKAQIDNALAQGWINQEEYDQTMAYKIV